MRTLWFYYTLYLHTNEDVVTLGARYVCRRWRAFARISFGSKYSRTCDALTASTDLRNSTVAARLFYHDNSVIEASRVQERERDFRRRMNWTETETTVKIGAVRILYCDSIIIARLYGRYHDKHQSVVMHDSQIRKCPRLNRKERKQVEAFAKAAYLLTQEKMRDASL